MHFNDMLNARQVLMNLKELIRTWSETHRRKQGFPGEEAGLVVILGEPKQIRLSQRHCSR